MRIRKSLLATLGATVLATGAALVIMAGPAEAATGQITGYAGKCVDVSGANSADGTQIQLWTCNGTVAQQWNVGSDGTIRALGKCMDVTYGGTANGTRTWLWGCNGTGAQQWRYDSSRRLVNPQSGRCLDVTGWNSADGTPLQIWDCHDGDNQKWTLPSGTPPPPGGSKMAAPYLYEGWGDPPSPATVMSATGIKQFTMAFMNSGGGCTPAWDSTRPLYGGVDQQAINTIRANGGDVQISFGGWSGNKLGPNCSSDSALAGAYQQVISAYGLKYIDIDIENTDEFENEVVQDRILNALRIVKQNNPGIKTIITFGTSTTGPAWWAGRLIDRSRDLGANIDVYTIMPFDFGCSSGMYNCTVSAANGLRDKLKSTFGWSDATAYAHMGISGMNGLSDQQEMTDPGTWNQIRDWANGSHIARLAFWSVNRDRPCPGGGVVSNCSGISQNTWQFTSITAGFTG
jgi:hypothetical protein